MLKTFLRWLALSVLLLIAEIFSLLLAPIIVLFADKKTGRLPGLFWWMETPTAALPGAQSFREENLPRLGWYRTSVLWLWRNSVYALADSFRVNPDFESVHFWFAGTKSCNNDPYIPGIFIGTMSWLDRIGNIQRAFEFRAVFPMPRNNCFVIRAGWKLSSWFDGKRPDKPTATGMLQALSIRPFQSRK